MAQVIEAVYEDGAFKPLAPVELTDGQRVTLSVEPIAMTPAQAESQMRAWQKVYEGLSDSEISEVEAIALDRGNFVRDRSEEDLQD